MKASPSLVVILTLLSLSLPACRMHEEQPHEEHFQIVVTSPVANDITITQQYVCQIHSRNHIEVQALQDGYLDEVLVKEGQHVTKGQVMFRILPTLYKARYEAEKAKAQLAYIKWLNTDKLNKYKRPDGSDLAVVSDQAVLKAEAELNEANAKRELAAAELNFTEVTAKFDGIVDRLFRQQGSLIEKKDILTNLSDNGLMWVYFNVPEARYLDYMGAQSNKKQSTRLELPDSRIELVLANGSTFNHDAGNTVTVEGKFNNETGNIPFRADFPNPDGLLRHGQTGAILIHRHVKNAIVIPQRATFEILDKRYVYVVDTDNTVHQRVIEIEHEMDDIFIVKSGVNVNDKIVLDGARQLHEGASVEGYEFRKPEEALANQKFHAE